MPSRMPGVIIVSDLSNLVSVYEKYFRDAGVEVIASFSGLVELLEFLKRSREDSGRKARIQGPIILLDYGMPGTHSKDILETLRRTVPGCKFLLTMAEYSTAADLREELYDAILRKPFTIREFLTTIQILVPLEEPEGSNVLEGEDEILKAVVDGISQTRDNICICMSGKTPVELLSSNLYLKLGEEVKTKGISVRFITEITYENLYHCKELRAKFGFELRHIEEVGSRFVLFDDNRLLTMIASRSATSPPRAIYSNVKSQALHYQNLFDNMLDVSIPADDRIRKLEEEIAASKVTMLSSSEESFRAFIDIFRNAKKFVVSWAHPRRISGTLAPELREAMQDAIKRGVRIRLITEITVENLSLWQERISLGIELRHFQKLVDLAFSANEIEFIAPTSIYDGRENPPLIYCNFPFFVQQQVLIFESMWRVSTPASERMSELTTKDRVDSNLNVNR